MGDALSVDGDEKPYDDVLHATRDQTIPTTFCKAYAAGKDAGPSVGLNADMRTAFGSEEHIYSVAMWYGTWMDTFLVFT